MLGCEVCRLYLYRHVKIYVRCPWLSRSVITNIVFPSLKQAIGAMSHQCSRPYRLHRHCQLSSSLSSHQHRDNRSRCTWMNIGTLSFMCFGVSLVWPRSALSSCPPHFQVSSTRIFTTTGMEHVMTMSLHFSGKALGISFQKLVVILLTLCCPKPCPEYPYDPLYSCGFRAVMQLRPCIYLANRPT